MAWRRIVVATEVAADFRHKPDRISYSLRRSYSIWVIDASCDACYAAVAVETKGVWLTFDQRAHLRLAGENLSHCLAEELPPEWNG